MLCIGITGGIGSGKSTATNIFSSLGITIIDADVIAQQLTAAGQPTLDLIIQHFGAKMLDTKSNLNRPALKETIFNQPEEKAWLEKLLHPLILNEINRQKKQAATPYCIISAPLLMEAKVEKTLVDRILVVDVDPKIQIERVKQRDNLSDLQISQIVQSQLSREQRLAKADDVIENNADLDALKRKVQQLHDYYLNLS